MNLPEPAQETIAISDLLKIQIVSNIKRQSGWISFADYMQQVLYTPVSGYYNGGLIKLGKQGDFITAPETTSLYSYALAQAIEPLLHQTKAHILELGAGTGRLAHDVLTALNIAGMAIEKYKILELSSELRQRQQQVLSGFDNVEWLSSFPIQFDGIVIANEVLDAMPVQLIIKKAGGWHELGVSISERSERFIFSERPCDDVLIQLITEHLSDSAQLPEGYISEIHTHAYGFMNSLSALLKTGKNTAAILIDYGFPEKEYYHPDRSMGTLMCHYQHCAHADPFFLPGQQDITSHINFTAVARLAEAQGMDIMCYTNQSSFLIGAGITDLLMHHLDINSDEYLTQSQAIQKLLSPIEMGEMFKVIVLSHNMKSPAFMLDIDKSGRL